MAQATSSRVFIKRESSSRLGQNVASNYVTIVWMGGLSLALIPVYMKLLGPSQWGIVAACISVQAFMSLLDLGLGQIMPRDIARVADSPRETATTFMLFSRAYLVLGVLGCALGQLAVPWLVDSWLDQGRGIDDDAILAFRCVLLQFVFQLANSAHIGYWNGLQAQGFANLRQCIFGTLKHMGALAAIMLWGGSPVAYLLPFLIVSALEYTANHWTIQREISFAAAPQPTVQDFRRLAREAGVLAVGVLVGMLISQVDRIVLSRTVDIESFGRYVIVANLGIAFMQLQYPLVRAYLPRIVQAQAINDRSASRHLGIGIFVLCILPCAVVALFAPQILQAWTRDPNVVRDGVAPLRLLLAAVALNAAYQPLYQRILARGSTHLILRVNCIVLAVAIPTAIFATNAWGITGAGFTWLASAVVQVSLGVLLARRGGL
jgi:O-antigen/teichoic acid export membrane protein